MARYRIELEGYNGGLPYQEADHTCCVKAHTELYRLRKESPKVRHRLIEVIQDFQ